VEGQDIADKIRKISRDGMIRPRVPATMKVRIERVSKPRGCMLSPARLTQLLMEFNVPVVGRLLLWAGG
jgi:hypothetical protein